MLNFNVESIKAIIKLIYFPDAPDQKWRLQTDWIWKGYKMDTKNNKNLIFMHRFLRNILIDSQIFKLFNSNHFQRQFTTLNQRLHNDRLEKIKILYMSVFSFSNFCHAAILMIGWVIFNFLIEWQYWKSTKVYAKIPDNK